METVNVSSQNEAPGKYNRGGRALGGLIIVTVGVIWLLKQMNFVIFPTWLFTWPVLLIVWGLYVGVRHGFRGWGGWLIIMFIGVFFLINDNFQDYRISDYMWPIAIIMIGLYVIIRPRPNFRNSARFQARWKHQGSAFQNKPFENKPFEDWHTTGETTSDDYIDSTSIFGGVNKVIVSKNFKGGDIVNIFGGCDINLTQADFTGTVTIDIVQIFGGAKIIVPTDWKIVIKTTSVFGGVEDKRPPALIKENPDKTLVIDGTSIFAGVSIQCY